MTTAVAAKTSDTAQERWWQTRRFVILLACVAVVPLLWPDFPPLTDLPGHMGRYRLELAIPAHPALRQWYAIRLSLIGNLGLDLLVLPLASFMGLELAVKAIVMATVALTVTGILWTAREVHGRIPATALLAVPLAYGFPFQFGFLNYLLSIACALNLFALWLRLGRNGRIGLRAALFVPAALLLWLCHVFGWAVLCILCFSAEIVRARDARRSWIEVLVMAVLASLPLAGPLLTMVLWRSGKGVQGVTAHWLDARNKAKWIVMVLRDRWAWFDVAAALLLYTAVALGMARARRAVSPLLGLAAVLLLLAFIGLPGVVFGSHYADMRLVPVLLAVALIALRPGALAPLGQEAMVAVAALVFVLTRLLGTGVSYWMYDRQVDGALEAFDHIPAGARVVSFVGRNCSDGWATSRLEHLPAMLIVRKLAFSNDQWALGGAQPIQVRYAAAGDFGREPSQLVYDTRCPRGGAVGKTAAGSGRPIGIALADFPRPAFDYVWLITPPPFSQQAARGLHLVWRNAESAVFRVDHGSGLQGDVRLTGGDLASPDQPRIITPPERLRLLGPSPAPASAGAGSTRTASRRQS